jgi:hypothetical protein
MRLYRERIQFVATGTTKVVTAIPVPSGYYRIYQGRSVINSNGVRGAMVAYLNTSSLQHILGVVNLATSTATITGVGLAEEAGSRLYNEGESWQFSFTQLVTGDYITLSLMGIEVTIYEYEKGIIP